MKRFILYILCWMGWFVLSAGNDYSRFLHHLPFDMPQLQLPDILGNRISLTEYGGVGDGITLNTECFREAIEHLSAKGGGTLVVPAGIWLTGPIRLKSHIELHLEKNALLIFTSDFWSYPSRSTFFTEVFYRQLQSPISAYNESDIAITGEGVIDGSGQDWRPVRKNKVTVDEWEHLQRKSGVLNDAGTIWYPMADDVQRYARREENIIHKYNTPDEWVRLKDYVRPELMHLYHCERVLLQGVTFQNSPFWNLHPELCKHLIVDSVCVRNPWNSQNGDGLDIESCQNVLVVQSTFDVGDDAVCIKSGRDEVGRLRGIPTKNVVVEDCTVFHGHGGFVVGSEMSGGVHSILVRNCKFLNTDTGLRFKSNRQRGGHVSDIYIQNVYMCGIAAEPILFDMYYQGKSAVEAMEDALKGSMETIPPVTEKTPKFDHIHISDVHCYQAGRALLFDGLPEQNISDITLRNVTIHAVEGGVFSECTAVRMEGVTIQTNDSVPLKVYNSKRLIGNSVICNGDRMAKNIWVKGNRNEGVTINDIALCERESDLWKYCEQVAGSIQTTSFRNQDYVISHYGAQKNQNITESLKAAIQACHTDGGGRVVIPKGEYYTAAIHLLSNVNLHLEKGAVLRFLTSPEDYLPVVVSRWEGVDCQTLSPLIYANGQTNVAITGAGTLDGQASRDNWWSWKGRKSSSEQNTEAKVGKDKLLWMEQNRISLDERIFSVNDKLRPPFIQFYRCNRVLVEGVTIIRSPFWMLHPLLSKNVIVRGVKFDSHGPNNDGCDPESCENVLIESCDFNNGDDCVAIKSGKNNDGRTWNLPSRNIIVRNCTMRDGHAGVAVGSEISGSCYDVWVRDCVMDSPSMDRPLRIKSNALRGGVVDGFYARDIRIGECKQAVLRLELQYERVQSGPYNPVFRNIYLENVTCNKSGYGILIEGFEDRNSVFNVLLKNCRLKGIQAPELNKIVGTEKVEFVNTTFNNKSIEK
ncbi:glycoside hydrolase family 28 protein [Bacteroides timonensis]|uniref:glycoside hydrolase family 28 protein n=1 Tax=Bacteroides timonensis TaxID=1470345 RepID=UPI0004AC6D7B|nr:glycoside hydrolase family 28 protein [Bacteroides timonensis]